MKKFDRLKICRHDNRVLYWQRRHVGDVTASVTCDDRRLHQEVAVLDKNGKPKSVNAANYSTTICQCSSRNQTAFDDSGIVVEDHQQQQHQHQQQCPARTESRRDETATDERADPTSATPTAAARLDVPSAERRRPGRGQCSSTHHWYRHRRRASNERRAMQRVAEWIDRNCGSCHDDRPAVAATTSLTLRVPEAGKVMLIVDSRPNVSRRLYRHHCDVSRRRASGCRSTRVDVKESSVITVSGQPFVVELVGLRQR